MPAAATTVPKRELACDHLAEGFRRVDLDLGAERVESFASGGVRASRNAAFSLATIPGGVPAGATTPSQNGEFSFG